MVDQHPITPPPELAKEWLYEGYRQEFRQGDCTATEYALAQAARWGADQELEACASWVRDEDDDDTAWQLRAARRPLPISKAQALETLRSMQIEPCWINGINTNAELMSKYDTIRRALEQLDD